VNACSYLYCSYPLVLCDEGTQTEVQVTLHNNIIKGKCKRQNLPYNRPRRHGVGGGEKRYSSTLSLTSALDGVSGQRKTPAALPQGKRPCTHYIGGWVSPRAGLDRCGKSRPHRDSIPGTPKKNIITCKYTNYNNNSNKQYVSTSVGHLQVSQSHNEVRLHGRCYTRGECGSTLGRLSRLFGGP